MISSLDPSADNFLANLARIQERLDRAQNQISSGLKVIRPSDAPDQIGRILQLRAEIGRTETIARNLGRVKSETDNAEQSLERAVQVVDRARVLASQSANSGVTAEVRLQIAQEVRGLHEQLVGLSRTAVADRQIFSGDQDGSPAYQVNVSSANGVDRLITAPATRQIEDPSGVSFTVARTAQEIFDNRNPDDTLAPDNVFAAVNGLRVALENNDPAGIGASLVSLRLAGDHLSGDLSFYGATQNRVDEGIQLGNKVKLQLTTDLGSAQDADLTEAILALNQGRTNQEAALSARAHLPRTSLFDFLG